MNGGVWWQKFKLKRGNWSSFGHFFSLLLLLWPKINRCITNFGLILVFFLFESFKKSTKCVIKNFKSFFLLIFAFFFQIFLTAYWKPVAWIVSIIVNPLIIGSIKFILIINLKTKIIIILPERNVFSTHWWWWWTFYYDLDVQQQQQRSSTFDFSHRKILVIKQQLPFILANHHHTHTADIWLN